MFPNNPSIKPIEFTYENVTDHGIQFNIKLLKLLVDKPNSTKATFDPNSMSEFKDPFVAPFEEGSFIDQITETHNLIFNKFSICERHVILVTS